MSGFLLLANREVSVRAAAAETPTITTVNSKRNFMISMSFMAKLAVSVSGWALALPLGHSPVRTEGASFANSLWIIARLASCAESLRFAFGLPSGLRLWESFVGFACGQPPSCVIPVSTGYTRGWPPAFAGCRPFGGASDSIPLEQARTIVVTHSIQKLRNCLIILISPLFLR